MFKVVVSHALCKEGMDFLSQQPDVEVVVSNTNTPADTLPYLVDADAFILRIGKMTKEMFDQCPKMKVVTRPGVGVDTIDVKYAASKGIPVVVTPGGNSRSVAEQVMMFMFLMAKNYMESYEETLKGNYGIRNKYAAFELEGKTLGVFGFGHIGRIISQMASGIGMKIAVYDPYVPEEAVTEKGYTYCKSVEEILPLCDVITLHMLSNEQTRGMFGASQFAMMKKGALLINCARGDLLKEDALYDALKSGQLGGCAEDMMCAEPFDLSSPLFTLKNFFVSPHMSALTKESSVRCALMAVEGTLAVLRGEKWPKVFDKSAYEHESWKDK